MKPAKPADPRLLWGFWVLAAAGILLFAFLLRTDLRSVHRLDPAAYTEPAPERLGNGAGRGARRGGLPVCAV